MLKIKIKDGLWLEVWLLGFFKGFIGRGWNFGLTLEIPIPIVVAFQEKGF